MDVHKEFPWWVDILIFIILLIIGVKLGGFKGRASGSTRILEEDRTEVRRVPAIPRGTK